MRQEISFHQGTLNSYKVDIDLLLSNKKYSFLIDNSVKKEFYYKEYLTESEVRKAIKEYSVNNKEDNSEIVPINEMTAKDIRAGADAGRLQRSRDKRIICNFIGVTPSRGWIKFSVSSQYIVGKHYTVYIKLKEANSLKYFKEFKKQDIIRLFLTGDLQMRCTCPDFKYRYSYMAWQLGYGLYKELRYPHIVNPQLKGSICKHCLAVLRVLQFNVPQITKQIIKSKFFKKKSEDEEYMRSIGNKSKKKSKK